MIETAVAQLRFVASVALGRPCPLWALERLIASAQETLGEFGKLGQDGADAISGPALDEETSRTVQLRRFRTQAMRAARETDYYGQLIERLGVDPARLRYDDIARLPITPKAAVHHDANAFVRRGAKPSFRTTTTGTTGRPTSAYFSEREMQGTSALAALTFLIHGEITSEDIVQISTGSRATLGNTCFAGACARIGAMWYLAGLVDPALALAQLAEQHRIPGKKRRTSVLSTYPSYLGELVTCGLGQDYRPADFDLERIFVGGELVTEGLKRRCQQLFGPVQFLQSYSMTETWPLTGVRCPDGHLHFEVSQGLVEVRHLETGAPAGPGEAGTIVATPFAAYRDAMPLLRYDTEDVVRQLATPLTCGVHTAVATTDILGKRRFSVQHDEGWTFPRDVLEALESVEAVPLPARYGFWAVPGGVAVEVVSEIITPRSRIVIEQALEARAVPVRDLRLVASPGQLQHPLPLRSDLREDTFPSPPVERQLAHPAVDGMQHSTAVAAR